MSERERERDQPRENSGSIYSKTVVVKDQTSRRFETINEILPTPSPLRLHKRERGKYYIGRKEERPRGLKGKEKK